MLGIIPTTKHLQMQEKALDMHVYIDVFIFYISNFHNT